MVVFTPHDVIFDFIVKDDMWIRQDEHQNCIGDVHGEEIQKETQAIPQRSSKRKTLVVKSCSGKSKYRTE